MQGAITTEISTETPAVAQASRLQTIVRSTARYGLSAIGPVCISGAHFLSAVLVLHILSPLSFGTFSFVMTVVPFCVSAAVALIGAPTTIGIRRRGLIDDSELATFQKANLVLALFAFAVVSGSLLLSGLGAGAAILFGLYGAAMSLRSLGRTHAFAIEAPARAAGSDLVYGTLLVAGMGALYLLDRLSLSYAAIVLALAATASMLLFDRAFLVKQFAPSAKGRLADYIPVWRDLTRWSLLGVAATELTVNAHAYFVTFFSGPGAFALLALGSLLMRPVSVILASLPDLERPVMARAVGAGDMGRAWRAVKEFRTAAAAVLLATTLFAAVLLFWFPQTVLKQGYDAHSAVIIAGIWVVIMAVRALRTPDAVLLQACGEFQPLASIGMKAALVSMVATIVLLVAFGPIASLLGIVAGDLVMTLGIFQLSRRWSLAHA